VWLYDTDTLLKKVLANPHAYGLKDNTTYRAGNDVTWCMYNGLSRGFRADDLLLGDNYHISPPVHLEIARGVRRLLPTQLL
jgi:phospholipase/lecithinase/hemolysin